MNSLFRKFYAPRSEFQASCFSVKTINLIVFVFVLLSYQFATSVTKAQDLDEALLCDIAIENAEIRYGIPEQLLKAIGLVEAGYQGRIWPWTVNYAGKARRYLTYFDAIQDVRRVRGKGRTNIDLGCLQLNMNYAAKGMAADEALDPEINADQAAAWLYGLFKKHGSWTAAVKHYHSGRRSHQRTYVCKVYRVYSALLSGEAQEHAWCRKNRS